MKSAVLVLVAVLAVVVSGGCSQSRGAFSEQGPASVGITKDGFDQAWDETLDVLREYNFEPDRQDVRAGVITTFPVVSQQWFEFWRADAQGWDQWLESSLHLLRRWVEVRFQPAPDGYTMLLTVYIERKSQPERQATTASGALQIYREKLPIYTGETLKADEAVRWIAVGYDGRLAEYLLSQIENRLSPETVSVVAEEGFADEAD